MFISCVVGDEVLICVCVCVVTDDLEQRLFINNWLFNSSFWFKFGPLNVAPCCLHVCAGRDSLASYFSFRPWLNDVDQLKSDRLETLTYTYILISVRSYQKDWPAVFLINDFKLHFTQTEILHLAMQTVVVTFVPAHNRGEWNVICAQKKRKQKNFQQQSHRCRELLLSRIFTKPFAAEIKLHFSSFTAFVFKFLVPDKWKSAPKKMQFS